MSIKKALTERTKECPRCWVKMDREEVEVFGPNIEIDVCPKCKGIWLEENELGKIIKNRKIDDYLSKDLGTKSRSTIVCPRCGGLMDIEHADDIQVDTCLTCHGIWLDEGELESLKTKSGKGFEKDEIEKAAERYEDSIYNKKTSVLNRFVRKLLK